MLIVGLIVGVGIGLLQALTQIQEATLVYAPKIVAIFVSLLIFLPLMGALMSGFMRQIAAPHRRHVAGRAAPMESYATAQQVYAAGLIFARLGAIVMLIPGIGESFVPPRIRLSLRLRHGAVPVPGRCAPAIRAVPPTVSGSPAR